MAELTHFPRLAVCLAVLLACACTYETETGTADFALSRYSVAFPASGGTTTVTVASTQDWTASTDAAWLTLTPDGTLITLTAEANDEVEAVRSAEIPVTSASGETLILKALQEPAEAATLELNYGAADPEIDSEGGTLTVSVASNRDWTAGLETEIDGWTLTTTDNTLTVTASANDGDSKTGTVLVTAGPLSREIQITQISRSENGYFQCTGTWDIYADNWSAGTEILDESGTFDSCVIAQYDLSTAMLSLIDIGLSGTESDRLEYNARTRTVTLPTGYLVGTTRAASGYYFYLYLVPISMSGGFVTNLDLTLTLSDDGKTLTVDNMPEDYPWLGIVGYNAYLGYTLWGNAYYPSGSITLRKASTQTASKTGTQAPTRAATDASTQTASKTGTQASTRAATDTSTKAATEALRIDPVDTLPDGVPLRLISGTITLLSFPLN